MAAAGYSDLEVEWALGVRGLEVLMLELLLGLRDGIDLVRERSDSCRALILVGFVILEVPIVLLATAHFVAPVRYMGTGAGSGSGLRNRIVPVG